MASGERHPTSRRLAAILAADVVGYSRLMGDDEVGTLGALKKHHRELIDPTIADHRGRIVKTTGDGLLAEFRSIVDAVTCAVVSAKWSAATPPCRRIAGSCSASASTSATF